MKTALVVLIFCLSFNFISSSEVFNAPSNHTSNIHHSASHLEGFSYPQRNQVNNDTVPHQDNDVVAYLRGNPYQQQPHSHNTTLAYRQANDVNNNEVIQQNRSRSPGNQYQLQRRLRNTTAAQRQTDPMNNLIVHPRFRPLLADEKANINTKNSSGLLQVLTTKLIDNNVQTQKPFSFADYYYHEQLRAFFGHKHDEASPHTHSYIKTGLRR
jgi:hypothetical protein